MTAWYFNPHTGGTKVPKEIQDETLLRITEHARRSGFEKRGHRISVRFRNQFCYVDAFESGQDTPTHLCRMRWSGGRKNWSLAFYSYASESYKPCVYESGDWYGTPEEALKIGSVYLS